ncbi:MAG: DUF4911 domain-containing protein [Acetomicrobium sp.]|jgi:hypothetical protein|uniref:DUF4911 domain-containing protein n=1 Tax=Acetomicrobium TaxID=49894 RepID=UPI001699C90D|nr:MULTISPECIES: DUF4911 domain-containing protein [Acetomicrobium]MDI9376642.1 DUF4911 domain-containing protein [Synergistota bacterium]NLI43180.1 DUF4911 domain-containing protein [Synergistaceae bacterium]MBP8674699.1 DUF4911 domain-containing protein [Acetomicrobium sp.]MDR9770805.1 DUF4911 domain-containing protein [Acetomicrobium sp.]HOB10447.1 DUF4911 domain-containing protein [Acetomicrobium sp.]
MSKIIFCKILLQVPESEIFYLSAIVDSYDNLGYVRKEEAPSGHTWLFFSNDMKDEVYELLLLLQDEIEGLKIKGEPIAVEV